MIAAFKTKLSEVYHAVFWTGKDGLMTVTSSAYCGTQASAGDGVFQVCEGQITCSTCLERLAQAKMQHPDPVIAKLKRQLDEMQIVINKLSST